MLASLLDNDVVQAVGLPLFQFQIPISVTMTIAATRMHRSLVNFATSDMCAPHPSPFFLAHSDRCRFSTHQNFQISGLRFAKPIKQIRAPPIASGSLDPVEIVSVHTVLQQHLTPQMSDRGLSTNVDEEVHQELNGLALDGDVERGELKVTPDID
jgi:hypothetical protein